MKLLEIVVPARNEEANIPELVKRIHTSLSANRIPYGIIVVDDNSTDKTAQVTKKLSAKYPVTLLSRVGNPGKAFAILDGIKKVKAKHIAIIDADLQYPPELLPDMYKKAVEENAVIVANRKTHNTSFLRKIASRANAFLFRRLLGFKCDIQSGLKVFTKEIGERIDAKLVTKWTIDMHILKTAREWGYAISSVDCTFSDRKTGKSKIHLVSDSLEIAKEAMKLSFTKKKPYVIAPTSKNNMVGSGVVFKGKKYVTHTTLQLSKSALYTFTTPQKIVIFLFLATIIAGLIIQTKTTAIILLGVLSLIYFIDVLFAFYTLMKSLHSSPELSFSDEELAKVKNSDLPMYTILCPLYKESHVLPHFIDSIEKLDWPKRKLDVLLLLEENDPETIEVAQKMKLPSYVRIVVVPNSQPKTKPKACNYGLNFAKGEYLVIYDAEDRPEPSQLKKAYLGFKTVGKDVVCLQSKLNYYNPGQNILTRLFTSEYSLWFDITLPGFQSLNTVIPLGGTSNHFKTKELYALGGWDPFNVTEDCDLGVRLFKEGKKTAIIDSTTFEEANSNVKNWIRQRSRWIKGYYQTYLVHMRNPIRFFREFGRQALIFQLVIGMRTTFMLINPFLWLMTFAYFAFYAQVGLLIESLFPPIVFYTAVIALIAGNFLHIYAYMIGCAKRGSWGTVKYVYFMPFYWLLSSIASFMAFYQLITKPFYWEKTNHGLHLIKKAKKVTKKDREPDISDGLRVPSLATPFSVLLKNVKEFAGVFTFRRRKVKNHNLRILIFNWRDTKHEWAGGAESYLHELSKRWVKNGASVTLFCGRDGDSLEYEIVDGVEVVRRGGFYTVYIWAVLYYLFKFTGKYDIVIDSENGIPFFTPLFVRAPKILIVYHVHQNYLRELGKKPTAYIARYLESLVMPVLYQSCQIVTVSESAKKDLVALGFKNEDMISVITPGVEIQKKRYAKTKHPSFIYLGRLKAYKNVDVALEAFSHVHKKHPKARFTVAGTGELHEDLVNLTKKLKIENAVTFTGRISDDKKYELLSKSWVAIQPSSHEGWGMTVIESNACYTPVIASHVHGLCDSVCDGQTGILVKLKNVDELVKQMEVCIVDSTKRKKLSKQSYKWAERFDWNTLSSTFLSLVVQQIPYEIPINVSPEFALSE